MRHQKTQMNKSLKISTKMRIIMRKATCLNDICTDLRLDPGLINADYPHLITKISYYITTSTKNIVL